MQIVVKRQAVCEKNICSLTARSCRYLLFVHDNPKVKYALAYYYRRAQAPDLIPLAPNYIPTDRPTDRLTYLPRQC